MKQQRRGRQSESQYWFYVTRGFTNFPARPIVSDRFLIGSGTVCQVQVAEGLPVVHSVVVCDPPSGRLSIEALCPEPWLFVNGEHRRTAPLEPGDRVAIHQYEFAVHHEDEFRGRRPHAVKRVHEMVSLRRVAERGPLADLVALSASELVDRLERELATLDRLGDVRQDAARELLEAIAARSPQSSGRPAATVEQVLAALRRRHAEEPAEAFPTVPADVLSLEREQALQAQLRELDRLFGPGQQPPQIRPKVA